MAEIWNVINKVMDTEVTKCTCGFKGYSGHKGADLVPKSTAETPDILAFDDGIVIYTGNVKGTNKSTGTAGMGTCVAIKHKDNTITRYQHLKYNSIPKGITKGATVKRRQKIGVYGRPETTGNSSGCHLHFDISLPNKPTCDYIKGSFCGETRYYVDPKPYLCQSEKANTKTVMVALNVRSGPGMNYPRIKVLVPGTKVNVLEERDGWTRIDINRWVASKHLK